MLTLLFSFNLILYNCTNTPTPQHTLKSTHTYSIIHTHKQRNNLSVDDNIYAFHFGGGEAEYSSEGI